MKDWKQPERRIAGLLGGQRIPVSGRQRGTTPDIEHATLSIEVKSRKALRAWLLDALLPDVRRSRLTACSTAPSLSLSRVGA